MPPFDEYDLKFTRFFRTHDFRPIEEWRTFTEIGLPDSNIILNSPYVNNFDPLVPSSFQSLMDYLKIAENDTVDRWLDHLNTGIIKEIDIETLKGVRNIYNAHSHFYYAYQCDLSLFKMTSYSSTTFLLDAQNPDQPTFQNIDNGIIEANRCFPSSSVELLSLESTQNSVGFQISNDEPTWIELSLIWYPGWVAYSDDFVVDVYKVNGIFLGTKIEAGKHIVEFKYEPSSYKVGLIISTSTIVLLLIFTALFQFRILGNKQYD